MKAIAKKIASVMMASVLFGAGAVVLPESVNPAAITASAANYTTDYESYRIPVYGYNYGVYYHNGNYSSYDRECIQFIQAWCNAECKDEPGYKKLDVDGYYGPNTAEGVKTLQKKLIKQGFNLTADGIFGPITFYAAFPNDYYYYDGYLYKDYLKEANKKR